MGMSVNTQNRPLCFRTVPCVPDRFKSEPVEDHIYFDTVLVYIHRNPIKAGICKKPNEYKYSSYNEYIDKAALTDTGYVFGYLSLEQFIKYNEEDITTQCLDITEGEVIRVTDEEAKDIIKRVSRCDGVAEFQALEIGKRDKCLKKLRDRGLSIRQISRLTGVSFNIVRKF